MSWIAFGILIGYLIIDQIYDYHKKICSVQIHDYRLANDPQFIEDLAEAVKRSMQRDLIKNRQNMIS